jgi:predicted dehydrogenase
LFESAEAMFKSGSVDAVLIATPHFSHPSIGIQAFENGLHVLCEKPVGVYTKQVRKLNEAADNAPDCMFGVMWNQRTIPVYRKMHDLILSGELGELKRSCWIITTWYRPQSYYDQAGWRGTWSGEGGGVLMNQSPHQLDMWQWICGLPSRVRAFCSFGKYHDIEVEDEVTAYVEYENGAIGTFITSTAETPGTNYFEVVGSRGKIVVDDEGLKFWRTRQDEREFNRTYKGGFGQPECWLCNVPVEEQKGSQHAAVTQSWVDAIRQNDASLMVADGREGLKEVELCNAMLMSEWTDDWVDIPIDDDKYYELLSERAGF